MSLQPSKWCIYRTDKNYKEVNQYFNNLLELNYPKYEKLTNTYMHWPPLDTDGMCQSSRAYKDYILLTDKEFFRIMINKKFSINERNI